MRPLSLCEHAFALPVSSTRLIWGAFLVSILDGAGKFEKNRGFMRVPSGRPGGGEGIVWSEGNGL
jgi:hypothetical protein